MANENEKTTIGMNFVDDGQQNEEPKEPKPVEVKDERGFFRKVWDTVTFPGRWVVEKVKDSPAAAAIGMVAGAGLTLGAKATYDHFRNKGSGDYIPADTEHIEVPDYGEEYAETSTSTED